MLDTNVNNNLAQSMLNRFTYLAGPGNTNRLYVPPVPVDWAQADGGGMGMAPGGGSMMAAGLQGGGVSTPGAFYTPKTAEELQMGQGFMTHRMPSHIYSLGQGLAEMGQTLMGTLMTRHAMDKAESDYADRGQALQDAAVLQNGRSAETRSGYTDTGVTVNPEARSGSDYVTIDEHPSQQPFSISWNAQAPNPKAAMALLLSNPKTQDVGATMQQQQMAAALAMNRAMNEKGFMPDPATGGVRPITGGWADPSYLGSSKQAEASGAASGQFPYDVAKEQNKAQFDVWTKNNEPVQQRTPGAAVVIPNQGPMPSPIAPPGTPGAPSGAAATGTTFIPSPQVRGTWGAEGAPTASPTSSDNGYGQFTQGTWLGLIKQYLPPEAKGVTDDQLLALRNNPSVAAAMTEAYAKQNAPVLQNAGITPTPESLDLAHFLGPGGATKMLQANRNAPATSAASQDAVDANRPAFFAPNGQPYTVGQFIANRSGAFAKGYAAPPPQAQGQPQQQTQSVQQAGQPGMPPQGSPRVVIPGRQPGEIKGEEAMSGELGKWRDAYLGNQPAIENLNMAMDALKQFQSGKFAGTKAELGRILTGIGVDPSQLDLPSADPAQILNKAATNFIFNQIKSVSSRPAYQEFAMLEQANPNKDLEPAANLAIGKALLAKMRWENGLYEQAVDKFPNGVPDNKFVVDYVKGNPMPRYVEEAGKEIGPLAGMPGSATHPIPSVPNDLSQRQTGSVYSTPRGPMIWRGNGWEPVR